MDGPAGLDQTEAARWASWVRGLRRLSRPDGQAGGVPDAVKEVARRRFGAEMQARLREATRQCQQRTPSPGELELLRLEMSQPGDVEFFDPVEWMELAALREAAQSVATDLALVLGPADLQRFERELTT